MKHTLINYSSLTSTWRLVFLYLAAVAIAIGVSFVMGVSSALMLQGALPIHGALTVLVGLIAIWMLPIYKTGPEKSVVVGMIVFAIAVAFWPAYMSAIPFPGNTWLSVNRLVLYPTLILTFVGLSSSQVMRENLWKVYSSNKPIFVCVSGLTIVHLLAVPLSPNPTGTFWNTVKNITYTFGPFIALAATLSKPKQLNWIFWGLILALPIWGILAPIERGAEQILFTQFMPSWAFSTDETTATIMQPTYKGSDYRVKGPAITPVEFAELLGLILPFAIHLILDKKNLIVKAIGVIFFLLGFLAIFLSTSRLGMVISIVGTVFYALIWGLRLWVSNKRGLLGPAVTSMFPVLVIAVVGVILTQRTAYNLVLGGNAETAASTDARFAQWELGLPKVATRPVIGHGYNTAAEVLGYTNPSGVLTIDTYWLSVLLDSGLLGFGFFMGFVYFSIVTSMRLYINPDHESWTEKYYLGAISCSFAAFIVGKLVLSQQSNHSVVFIFAGILCFLNTYLSHKDTAKAADID
jgi:hypothetical protein